MNPTKIASIGLAAALAALLPAIPAQAEGASRTFVSAAGSDSNNCANVATPCRHFAAAYAATAPSGEIFVLDPANYGSLTITHAVSIQGHGWASIAPPNNGNGITINASSGDSISIHGVAIDGTGATGGTNGIVFNAGSSLTVSDCVVQNLHWTGSNATGDGILIQPTSGAVSFVITNTVVSNNGYVGIFYTPPSGSATANGVIDHVVATNNQYGIIIDNSSGLGSAAAAISNSIASNNSTAGIVGENAAARVVSIDSTDASGNANGIEAYGTTKVTLGRSVITANSGHGIFNNTSPNTFYSYEDNRINFNVVDVQGAALNSLAQH
jgi:hypothetical protein